MQKKKTLDNAAQTRWGLLRGSLIRRTCRAGAHNQREAEAGPRVRSDTLGSVNGLLKGRCAVQERITSEKQRLASVRVRETSDVARAAEALSGQAVSAAPTLEELLRRPHVHYRRVFWRMQGKWFTPQTGLA